MTRKQFMLMILHEQARMHCILRNAYLTENKKRGHFDMEYEFVQTYLKIVDIVFCSLSLSLSQDGLISLLTSVSHLSHTVSVPKFKVCIYIPSISNEVCCLSIVYMCVQNFSSIHFLSNILF